MEYEHRDVQGQTNTGLDVDKMDTMELAQKILHRNNPMGSQMSNHNSETSPATRTPRGSKITDKWKIAFMNAYMTYYKVACPKKTNGKHSKTYKEKIGKLQADRLKHC